MKDIIKGHIAAFLTILVWGTTYVSTKVLLRDFSPIEILLIRFIIAITILTIISPKILKYNGLKEEFSFALAGLCGICLYFLFENIALTYTMASNVGVILAVIPFFTAILAKYIIKTNEILNINFFIGFIIAIIGISLISFNGSKLELNPLGDILTVFAAFAWALYQVITRKIGEKGYNSLQVTKKVFIYGIFFVIISTPIFGFNPDIHKFILPQNLFNFLFLGVLASAICFVSWTYALKRLGAIKTSVYAYISPIITVITAMIVLNEKLTVISAAGIVLTLTGLIISELKSDIKKADN